MLRTWIVVCLLFTLASTQAGLFTPVIGTWPNNSISWQGANTDQIGAETDGQGGDATFDIVGDGTHAALQYGQDNNYAYFRLQIGHANIMSTSLNGSYMIYVDRLGWQASTTPGTPDFAFAWDSKSNDVTKHGLEMMKYGTLSGGTWGNTKMDDVDNSDSTKGTSDINGPTGSQRVGDGMVRVETGATGASGAGANSYVEFAISWYYLTQHSTTQLAPGQSWNITAGTITAENDHGNPTPDGDILGFSFASTPISGGPGWALPGITPVPEPVNVALGVFGVLALGGTVGRRFLANRRTKKA